MAPARPTCEDVVNSQHREVNMNKLIFIALVVIAGMAVILDDGRARPNRRRR